MAALVRIGLGLLLTLAPALCCCQARWLTAGAAASPVAPADPAPRSAPACPHCCKAEEPAKPETPAPRPAPETPHCVYCDGQASAITGDPQPRVEPPGFAGKLLPAPAFLTVVALGHPAFRAGVFPSERTGVDARCAALFGRHVMHC